MSDTYTVIWNGTLDRQGRCPSLVTLPDRITTGPEMARPMRHDIPRSARTTPMSEAIEFSDLQQRAERCGPRYDVKYGRCPACGLGPTMMIPLPPATWAACAFCWLRWPVGVDLFDIPPVGDPAIAAAVYEHCMELLCPFDDVTIARVVRTDSRPEGEPMKLTKKTITIELPASASALTGELDPRTSPTVADAERELADANAQLEAVRDDLRQRRDRVEVLALGDDAAAHAREFSQLQAAKARVPAVEGRVARAEAGIREARDAAIAAMMREARKRHDVVAAAARVLVAELAAVQQLEDALNAELAQLPSLPGAGLNYVGGVRELAVTAVLTAA